MKIAVTGGSGQLGALVLQRLAVERGVKQIVSIDKRPPTVPSPRIRAVTADIRDPDLVRHLEGCDAVVHLAFVVTGWLPRAEFDAINVGGSENVFRAAAKAGATRIVYSSSAAAYGVLPGHPIPIVESTPRRHQADFPYSSAKYRVEQFLDRFEAAHPHISIARLRPVILVGARMENALGDALRRRVLVDLGGTHPMPLVWDEDVADAAILALRKRARGAFNLAAEEPKTVRELARASGLKRVRLSAPIVRRVIEGRAAARKLLDGIAPGLDGASGGARTPDPAWLRSAGATLILSSERARAELGWSPRHATCVDVLRHHAQVVPTKTDPRVSLFLRMVELATQRAKPPEEVKHVTAAIHLALTGPDGGDFALRLAGGRMHVDRGVPRPPTSTVTLTARQFLDLLSGRADFYTSQFTGAIRVQGDPSAAMILQGIVSTFRQQGARRDPLGWIVRALSSWFARGGGGDAAPRPPHPQGANA